MSIKFRQNDFQEVHYCCVFVNQTSGFEFRNYKQVKIEEFHGKGITIILPTNTCNVGHNLMLLFFKGRNPKVPKVLPEQGEGKGIHYSAIGKVKIKSPLEKNQEFCTAKIDFNQFDKYGWQELLDEYREKQEEVTSTFSRIQINEK
ncbi:MAG: hypothetical protein ACJAS4_001822 [Bacteriovoracaceae bacterium]|jgi:hypothetical protein